MRDLLPDFVRRKIREHYITAIYDAQTKFEFSEGDEDALTGALGSTLSMPGPEIIRIGDQEYQWRTYYRKIRGRGPGAPEGSLGGDGIFEIEVLNSDGEPVRRKGLLFQAKKRWRGTDSRLAGQAADMITAAGEGIVIDFTPDNYEAVSARDVVEMGGRRTALQEGRRMRRLGHVLGDDFLNCDIGVVGLFYDHQRERLAYAEIPVPIDHVIATRVVTPNPD